MAIGPIVLNETNSGYGFKRNESAWKANRNLLADVRNYYVNGAYQQAIAESLSSLKNRSITSIGNLQYMNEGDLDRMYYIGVSYRKSGFDTLAVAPLQIAYSQAGFVSH